MSAEDLLFKVGEEMLSKVISLAADEISLAWGFKTELERLEKSLRKVNLLICDASSNNKTQDGSVQEWLRELNEVAYKADAVLDEYSYETLRSKIETRKRDKVLSVFSPSKNPLLIHQRLAHTIRKVNVSLDECYAEGTRVKLVEKVATTTESNRRLDHPFIQESFVVGRDDDIMKVVDLLCGSHSDVDDDFSVMAVIGIGGQGKTTLAKLVCKHDKVLKHFNEIMWITVSEDFDVTRLFNEMIESLTKEKSQLTNVQAIIKKLVPTLQMKRYLLVLDDVWNRDEDKWSCFRSALLETKAANGSRILTTTRDIGVASTMKTSHDYKLQRLSDAESWTIFKKRAFAQGGAVETAALVDIGKDIVKKCQGLPLAIKVIGSLMFSKHSENEWMLVQNSQLWNLDDSTNRVLQSLKLSYDHLSFPLKRCFSFCSFYPKDEEIEKNELIQRWMALGLLQPPLGSGLEMEDVGDKYFKTLLSCSLLEDANMDEVKAITICKMHDIVHDLALTTVQMDYSVLNSQALVSSQINSKLHLRVLVLHSIENLPGAIKKLKHLRYLDISKTSIYQLPNSITKLYNLQTLKVNFMSGVPKVLENLINLRHLCVKVSSRNCMLVGIERLTCLQTLTFFYPNREKGCHIKELAGLKDLRGELTIFDLDQVESTEDAKQALLSEKSHLRTLTLFWPEERRNGDGSTDNHENVLKGLEPPSKLEGLTVENFNGGNFPPWMMVESHASQVLGNLVKLRLVNCDKCDKLPTVGQLQHLKFFQIARMSNIESIGQEFYGNHTTKGGNGSSSSGGLQVVTIFPALVELTLTNFPKLERWEEAVQQRSMGSMNVFPCLKKFHIENCPYLKTLPSHFPSVTDLSIRRVKNSMSLKEMSKTLTTLTSLEIVECNGSEFQSIMGELLGNNNTSLRELIINNCDEFLYLPDNLVTLEKLKLISCAKLKYIQAVPFAREVEIDCCTNLIGVPSLTEAFPVLEKLYIRGCDSMVEFPDMNSQKCLRELSIYSMENLTSVPSLSKSLRRLEVDGCGRLTYLPEELGEALRDVGIKNCSDLVSLPDFRNVQTLSLWKIGYSKGLDCFPWASSASSSCDVFEEEEKDDIQCIKSLFLWGWPEIKSLPEQLQKLTALTRLILVNFEGLESLPDWLGNLSSLQYLYLGSCEKLKYLPSLEAMRRLTQLDELFILGCPLLESRCIEGTRPEWIKISHIPKPRIPNLPEIMCKLLKHFIPCLSSSLMKLYSFNPKYVLPFWLSPYIYVCACEFSFN